MRKFVLVPGAWLGAWVWKKVTPIIEQKGHKVYPITLTGMGDRVHLASREIGMDTAAQDVLNVIEYEDLNDVILVGHSFAGMVVSTVADRIPRKINTLLFLDAAIPKSNVRNPQTPMIEDSVLEECRKNGEGWKFPLTMEMFESIGQDVQGKDREWFLSKITPIPLKLFSAPVTLSENYDSLKKAYIFCRGGGDDVDRIVREAKLEGQNRIIESGHWPMVSRPAELVDAVLSLVST